MRLAKFYSVLVVGIMIGLFASLILQTFLGTIDQQLLIKYPSSNDKFLAGSIKQHPTPNTIREASDTGQDKTASRGENADSHGIGMIQEEQEEMKPMEEQDIYGEHNKNRQGPGRNMQGVNDLPHSPINMLYEELTPRKTLLVAVVTSVQRLMSHTIAIHGTWGRNAQNLVYFTGEVYTMPHLPSNMNVVQLEGIDDRQASWEIKEHAVITYLISHYSDSVDWFLLVGDSTFVSANSLKMKLEDFNAGIQVYMGRSMEGEDKALCNPKTGIVYSRGMLNRLESYLALCAGEELTIGQCINARGIYCTQAKEVCAIITYYAYCLSVCVCVADCGCLSLPRFAT